MNNSIMGKLLEIETALRGVREELEKLQAKQDQSEAEAIDFGELVDVTPAVWAEWFSTFKYNAPTPLEPYLEFFPNIVIGYPKNGEFRANIEQNAYVSKEAKLRHAFEIWLIGNVDWFTIEIWIPPRIWEDHADIYFSWRASVDQAQQVEIYLYESHDDDVTTRTKISTRLFSTLATNDVIRIERKKDKVKDRKVCMSFSADSFHAVKFEDIRLAVSR